MVHCNIISLFLNIYIEMVFLSHVFIGTSSKYIIFEILLETPHVIYIPNIFSLLPSHLRNKIYLYIDM